MDNHFSPRFINSLLFVCFYFSLSTVGTYATNCTSIEREALVGFKQGLSDPSARLSSWIGENCCEWSGVTCDLISGKVTKIDLRNSLGYDAFRHPKRPWVDYKVYLQEYKKSCLGGDVNSSLLELTYLNYLDLSLNNFEGASIPYFFGMLKNLRYLNLSSANFGGVIPLYLGNLSNLNYLDLSSLNFRYLDIFNELEPDGERIIIAKLHVENFQWLSDLIALEYLDLGGMNLSIVQANWMHAVNRLSSLIELHLSSCDISSFDSSIGFLNLTSLQVLEISNNPIYSSLPPWLSNITSLTKLDLHENRLQGTIPPDFLKLKNLQYFDVSRNRLGNNGGDHIPSLLRNLCKLQFLDLAQNNFGGKLVEFFDTYSNCSHNNLETLYLFSNKLMGEIPNSLGTFENLQSLDLSSNKLWGSLPNSIGNLSSLQHLVVSDNLLNGTIPPSFGQLSELIQFLGEENSWEVVITEVHLVNLTKLEYLFIASNKDQAWVFNMSRDWIPPFRLKSLSLKNCLVGPHLPLWIQVQTQLKYLTLFNTGISGFIPNGWVSNLSLDLSNNLLTNGKLSHLLASYNSNLIDGSDNLLQNSIMLKYPNLEHLDLQKNSFSGPIPSNMGDLMPNLKRLYLSENYVNGTIPSSIQKMRYLEVLSIPNNRLSGELNLIIGVN